MIDVEKLANAIMDGFGNTLLSPNEVDRNMAAANVVDGLFAIARVLHDVAAAIQERTTDDDKRPAHP
jgi:hypothetical protein